MHDKAVFRNGIFKALKDAEILSGRKGSSLYMKVLNHDRRIIASYIEYNGVEHVFVVKFQTNGHVKHKSFPYHKFIRGCEIVRETIFKTCS